MENYDEYTSNEEMDSFQGGDNTIVVTGAVVRDDPHRRRANAPQPRVRVLRVILSNMQGREMRVLFWDQRVAEFENRILRQIIRISGPRVVVANPLYVDLTQNLMSIELSIQQSTTVDILGPIPAVRGPALPMAPSVELRNAGNMLGQVQITAFIRHPIQRQIIGNFTSASGAITDGVYHLCVNVAVPSAQMIPAGSHVTILGELRRNNHDTLILQVTEMTNIQIVDEQIMDPAQLRNGFHIIPRIAAGEQLPAIPNAAPQMQRHQFNAPVINHGNLLNVLI
ncbi:uncharacterized protein LOC122856400 [Aphidius gifuensis]|uniref:uncharacterized protein LOC122856400 n=1 Tax=Aphidius gifuensis TaxID=684658 RepID=UPI001CDB9793|nr:uncharacterized protein LOC122856400 [Aphidius gifuensis]